MYAVVEVICPVGSYSGYEGVVCECESYVDADALAWRLQAEYGGCYLVRSVACA